jgi:hypothetical protein
MRAFKSGYSGYNPRVSEARPAYQDAIAQAERHGMSVTDYSAMVAAELRASRGEHMIRIETERTLAPSVGELALVQ